MLLSGTTSLSSVLLSSLPFSFFLALGASASASESPELDEDPDPEVELSDSESEPEESELPELLELSLSLSDSLELPESELDAELESDPLELLDASLSARYQRLGGGEPPKISGKSLTGSVVSLLARHGEGIVQSILPSEWIIGRSAPQS